MGAGHLATGGKKSDLENPKLGWLKYFLKLGQWVLGFLRIQMVFPVFDGTVEVASKKAAT